MELGESISYDVYVLRYGKMELFADNFLFIESAVECVEAHGWKPLDYEIVKVEIVRTLISRGTT